MYEVPGFVYSLRSEGDIRQFRGVVINANGAIEEVGAADAIIDGVAQMPAAAANPEVIRIMKTGISFGIAGAVVDLGDTVAMDAEGRFVVTAIAADVVGKALTAAGAAAEEIAVLLK